MDEVAAAIADPVRRAILVMLREQRLPAGEIADRFAISRPAISRHLRVLRESGLVRDTLTGRHRHYELDASRFAGLIAWLDQFAPAAGWERRLDAEHRFDAERRLDAEHRFDAERRLDALETEVYRTRRERRRSDPTDHRQENTA